MGWSHFLFVHLDDGKSHRNAWSDSVVVTTQKSRKKGHKQAFFLRVNYMFFLDPFKIQALCHWKRLWFSGLQILCQRTDTWNFDSKTHQVIIGSSSGSIFKVTRQVRSISQTCGT